MGVWYPKEMKFVSEIKSVSCAPIEQPSLLIIILS
jgi:hypothetical protein